MTILQRSVLSVLSGCTFSFQCQYSRTIAKVNLLMAKKLYIAGYQDSIKEVHSDENVYFEPGESVLAQFSMKERDAI